MPFASRFLLSGSWLSFPSATFPTIVAFDEATPITINDDTRKHINFTSLLSNVFPIFTTMQIQGYKCGEI